MEKGDVILIYCGLPHGIRPLPQRPVGGPFGRPTGPVQVQRPIAGPGLGPGPVIRRPPRGFF